MSDGNGETPQEWHKWQELHFAPDLPEVQHIEVLSLKPGDVLVATLTKKHPLSAEARLLETLKQVFPGVKVFLARDVEFSVVRQESE